jgi:hypothetical protein
MTDSKDANVNPPPVDGAKTEAFPPTVSIGVNPPPVDGGVAEALPATAVIAELDRLAQILERTNRSLELAEKALVRTNDSIRLAAIGIFVSILLFVINIALQLRLI